MVGWLFRVWLCTRVRIPLSSSTMAVYSFGATLGEFILVRRALIGREEFGGFGARYHTADREPVTW